MATSLPPLRAALPPLPPTLPALPPASALAIERIAARQRQLLWWYLLLVLPVSIASLFAGAFAAVLNLAAIGVTVILVFRLGRALSVMHLWLWMLGCFVPVLGWAFLYNMNAKATKALQSAGIRVGFMGAKAQKGTSDA